MSKREDQILEALVEQATTSGMSRLSFIKRAVALGVTIPAVAAALDAIEGPATVRAASAISGSITFGSWASIAEQSTLLDILKAFQVRYPKVDVQPQFTSFSDYFVKLNADLAAKSIPDVMFLTYVPDYAAKGALVDIRQPAKAHGKDLSGYGAGQLFLFQWNGGTYGVPRDSDTQVIFYNRTLFKQASVAFPKDGWTYDDLRTAAKSLTKGSGSRISQYGYAFETGYWRLYLWQNGVELFDNDAKPTKVTFNTSDGATALQFMADLINKDQVTPPASKLISSADRSALFAGGKLAMCFGNHALVPTFAKTPGLDWFVVGMPTFPGKKAVNASGGAGYTMSKFTSPANRDAQYALWDWMTGPVAAQRFAADNDFLPVSPEALRSSAWLSKPYNKIFSQQAKIGHDFPSFASAGDVFNAVGTALEKLWIGEQSAADALAAAEKVTIPIIKKLK